MRRPRGFTLDLALFVGLAVAGCVVVLVAAHAAAGEPDVVRQVPLLVSGGFGGLLLVVTGAYLTALQVGRRLQARTRKRLDALVEEAGRALEALSQPRIS